MIRLTKEQNATIDLRIAEGILSNAQIAHEVGCDKHTVWTRRKARDDETRRQMQEDFGSGEPVYRGGGEW